VFATAATLAVSRIVLGDSIRLSGGQHRDVRAFQGAMDRIARPARLGEPFRPIPSRDIEVTFHEAGHILGSASIEISSGRARLLLSGDLGRPGSPILRDYNTAWAPGRPFDLVVMESTYGGREHEHDPGAVREALFGIVTRALKDGGHIVVPAFAVGRTQSLIYHLDALVESGRLAGLPVAIDSPMGLRMTEVYSTFRQLFDEEALEKLSRDDDPLDFKGLYAVRKGRDSRRLRDLGQSILIIAGSGMCTGGRVVEHLIELLPLSQTNVMFVGYQAPGTLGARIVSAAARAGDGASETVRVRGQEIPVRAHVDVLHGLSAHADRVELAAWLDAIPDVRKVALHHGEPASQEAFAKWYEAR
jgi:metallo-beta-lactamase family protein